MYSGMFDGIGEVLILLAILIFLAGIYCVLLTLKLCHVIDWSWWTITLLLLLPILLSNIIRIIIAAIRKVD